MLGIPGTQYFIDGNCENSPYRDVPRCVGVFANHSASPNAHIEKRQISTAGARQQRRERGTCPDGTVATRTPQLPDGSAAD